MAIGSRNPAHWSAGSPRETVKFFANPEEAREYHATMRAAGCKPRTTKLVDHRKPDGTPVHSWKVTTHAKPTNGS